MTTHSFGGWGNSVGQKFRIEGNLPIWGVRNETCFPKFLKQVHVFQNLGNLDEE